LRNECLVVENCILRGQPQVSGVSRRAGRNRRYAVLSVVQRKSVLFLNFRYDKGQIVELWSVAHPGAQFLRSTGNDLRDRQVCDLTDEGLEAFLAVGFLVGFIASVTPSVKASSKSPGRISMRCS
jgi:hypothetical protein